MIECYYFVENEEEIEEIYDDFFKQMKLQEVIQSFILYEKRNVLTLLDFVMKYYFTQDANLIRMFDFNFGELFKDLENIIEILENEKKVEKKKNRNGVTYDEFEFEHVEENRSLDKEMVEGVEVGGKIIDVARKVFL